MVVVVVVIVVVFVVVVIMIAAAPAQSSFALRRSGLRRDWGAMSASLPLALLRRGLGRQLPVSGGTPGGLCDLPVFRGGLF